MAADFGEFLACRRGIARLRTGNHQNKFFALELENLAVFVSQGVMMAPVLIQEMAVSENARLAQGWRRKAARWLAVGSYIWLSLAALLLVLLIWGKLLTCPGVVALYVASTVLCSLFCFVAYGLDKRRAAAERWRISEATLQWLAFFGGWPGGLLGQRTFRHKTQKVRFQLVFWLIVTLHLPLVLWSLLSISFGT